LLGFRVDSEIMAFSERAPASTSGESEPSIDPIQVCQNYTILNSQQLNICQRYPHATASAMQGSLPSILHKICQKRSNEQGKRKPTLLLNVF